MTYPPLPSSLSPVTAVSVVICIYTADRWAAICEAVDSVRRQTAPPAEIIVVVDHNPELLARATTEFPDLKVIANREAPGLSGARNTGIAASRGALLVFLDDDAVADSRMLQHLAQRCEDPDVLGAVATIEPSWQGARPGWLPDEFLWTVGCSYRGLPTATAEVRNVLGAAMILKRQVFERVGGFSGTMGRKSAGLPLSCEETELCIRARTAFPNGRFMLERSAVGWHKVTSARLTWRYFCLRCYAEGISKAYVTTLAEGRPALGTERRYVARTLSGGVLRETARFMFRFDPDGLTRAAAILVGLACASLGFAVGKLRPPARERARGRAKTRR